MKKILLFLLIASFSFASLIWEFSTDREIVSKPIVFKNSILAASSDGTIYSFDPNTGAKKWEIEVKGNPNEIFEFDNSVITSTRDGKVFKIASTGKEVWSINLNTTQYNSSRIYGASTNNNIIFITANNGIFTITKGGEVSKIFSYNNSVTTKPAAGADFVIFGKGDELFKLTESGSVKFKSQLKEGSFWESDPTISGGTVFVGALNGKMQAYLVSTGLNLWGYKTRNWVTSTPISDGKNVFFGSNDGNFYSLDVNSGIINWKSQTDLAIKTTPDFGYMGGTEVIFVGGSDKNIYAFSKETGEIVWKGPVKGAVGSPTYYQGKVYFGSTDFNFYAFSTSRACSITSPTEGELLDRKEVVIKGKLVTEAGGPRIIININNGEWKEANINGNEWTYIANPNDLFVTGLNTISCKEIDSEGEEIGSSYTSVSVNYDPAIEPGTFRVKTSTNVIVEDKQFIIFVNDAQDGSPVERFSYILNGEEKKSDKNITLTIDSPGTYKFTIKKIGFTDQNVQINVNREGVDPILLGLAIIAILVILWQVWSRFLKTRFNKKK